MDSLCDDRFDFNAAKSVAKNVLRVDKEADWYQSISSLRQDSNIAVQKSLISTESSVLRPSGSSYDRQNSTSNRDFFAT